jgi:hypothetical protein
MPKAFHLWAPLYPRLMFAAIDRDIANAGDSNDIEEMRVKLLGIYQFIYLSIYIYIYLRSLSIYISNFSI